MNGPRSSQKPRWTHRLSAEHQFHCTVRQLQVYSTRIEPTHLSCVILRSVASIESRARPVARLSRSRASRQYVAVASGSWQDLTRCHHPACGACNLRLARGHSGRRTSCVHDLLSLCPRVMLSRRVSVYTMQSRRPPLCCRRTRAGCGDFGNITQCRCKVCLPFSTVSTSIY